MDETKLAFSIFEACQRVGVGRTTLYTAIKTGALTANKVGRRTLVTQKALLAWLDGLPNSAAIAVKSSFYAKLTVSDE